MKPHTRGRSVNVHMNLVRLEKILASWKLKYACQAFSAISILVQLCASPHAWNAFHRIFVMLSTSLLLTSFLLTSSRCLNLDQAARGMPWFLQVCKTQTVQAGDAWSSTGRGQTRPGSSTSAVCLQNALACLCSWVSPAHVSGDCLSHLLWSYAFFYWSNIGTSLVCGHEEIFFVGGCSHLVMCIAKYLVVGLANTFGSLLGPLSIFLYIDSKL